MMMVYGTPIMPKDLRWGERCEAFAAVGNHSGWRRRRWKSFRIDAGLASHGLTVRVGVFFLNIVAYFGVADLIGMPKEMRDAPKRKSRVGSNSAPSKAHPFPKYFWFNIWSLKVCDNEKEASQREECNLKSDPQFHEYREFRERKRTRKIRINADMYAMARFSSSTPLNGAEAVIPIAMAVARRKFTRVWNDKW
jgi:hypothetical protein